MEKEQVRENKIIDKELYKHFVDKLYEKKQLKCFVEYNELFDLINQMRDLNKYNLNDFEEKSEIYEIFELLMLSWGLFSFATAGLQKHGETKMIFFSLSTQIANNLSSIMHLTLKGLNYQVGIISRAMYEIVLLLPVLLIEEKKREKYFESAKKLNSNKIWNDEFKFSQLNECLVKYEEKITKGKELKFLRKIRSKQYSSYSEYTHNSFLRSFVDSYTRKTYKNNKDDTLQFNLWGASNVKAEINFSNICSLMIYISYILQNIFSSDNKFYIDEIKDEQSREHWNQANYLLIIFREIYLYKFYNIDN